MTITNTLAVLVTAAVIAVVSTLIEVSTRLPELAAYFSIAAFAATLALLVTHRLNGTVRSSPRITGKAGKETGSVKWFSASKGFGFITRDNGEDIFVHFRSITGNGHRILREGQRVEFAVTMGSKGLQAEEVTALK